MSVYFWGLGKNGQLGTGNKETQHTPQTGQKTTDGRKVGRVAEVSCGALFSAIVTCSGDLFSTGCAKHGRLGVSSEEIDDVISFTRVTEIENVKRISCGSWHAAAVAGDGDLYIWGYGKVCGGGKESVVGIPRMLDFGEAVKIVGVSCGHNYTLAWSSEGHLYSWGKSQTGALGHGSETDVPLPTKVLLPAGSGMVIAAGAGHSHCGIVTDNGQLFMMGKGTDGALGVGQYRLDNIAHPCLCEMPTGLEGEINSVSCSKGEHHGHTLALTTNGQVLAWGDGYKGKLGLGDQISRYTPALISSEHFNNEKVVSISAGGIHSSAATETGSVFTWGCGSDGRLGHPDGQGHRYLFRSDVPRKVEELTTSQSNKEGLSRKRAQVSAAYYHTACIVGL